MKKCISCKKELPTRNCKKYCSLQCYWKSGVTGSKTKSLWQKKEYRVLMSAAHTGKVQSVETKARHSASINAHYDGLRAAGLPTITDKRRAEIKRFMLSDKNPWRQPAVRDKITASKQKYYENNPDWFLKQKKTQRGRGKSGFYYSQKNSAMCYYRSSWELHAYSLLENMSYVVSYQPEPFAIKYSLDGKQRATTPDLLIRYADGTSELVEIKPSFKIRLNIAHTVEKLEAMSQYAKSNNIPFSVWTEKELSL